MPMCVLSGTIRLLSAIPVRVLAAQAMTSSTSHCALRMLRFIGRGNEESRLSILQSVEREILSRSQICFLTTNLRLLFVLYAIFNFSVHKCDPSQQKNAVYEGNKNTTEQMACCRTASCSNGLGDHQRLKVVRLHYRLRLLQLDNSNFKQPVQPFECFTPFHHT